MTKPRYKIDQEKNNEMDYPGESFRDLIQEVEPEIDKSQLIEFAKFLNIPDPVDQAENFILSKT